MTITDVSANKKLFFVWLELFQIRIISIDTKYNTLYNLAPMKIFTICLHGRGDCYELVS